MPAVAERPTRRDSWRPWLGFLGLLVLSALIVAPHVARYVTLSPIDELQHIDYVVKASHFQEVRSGAKVGAVAMREQSCRGIDSPGFVSPPCDAPVLTPEMFQEGGYNTAAIHPPPYYVITGLLARGTTKVISSDSIVTGARLAGALWLALGLGVTFLLARALGATRTGASVAAVLLATLPVVVLSSATVTPDATALLSGSAVCLGTVRFLQKQSGAGVLAAGGLAATIFKVNGVLAVGVCCLLLLSRAWVARRSGDGEARRLLLGLPVLALAGSGPVLAWMLVSRLRALDVPPSPMVRFVVASLSPSQVIANLLALAPPTQDAYLVPTLRTAFVSATLVLGGYVVLGAVGAVSLNRTESPLVDGLGRATLIGMLAGGPFLVLLTYVVASVYVPIPSRYGLVLLPPAVAVLAVLASRSRMVLVAVGVIAGVQALALAHGLAS